MQITLTGLQQCLEPRKIVPHCSGSRQGPRLTLEVRRENEPLKKWYFNFGGLFLSQKKIYVKKLNGIGISYVWGSNFANLKKKSFTH